MRKITLILAALTLCLTVSCNQNKDGYVEISGYTQGGEFHVKFNTKGIKKSPEAICHDVDSILTCLDTTMSGYNPGSVLSRYNRGEKIQPNWVWGDIINRAEHFYRITEGMVDVASAPLFDLWGFGFTGQDNTIPSDEELAKVRAACGMSHFDGNLYQAAPGLKFNFNAIAQGYSCDVVANYLYLQGIKDMLVDIGEIYVDGKNPAGQGWTIAIDSPVDGSKELGESIQGTWVSDGRKHGIVTSGNYRKFFIKDGKKYSHTIDPRTGMPVQHNLLSATVMAEDACTADAMSTACMVMGLEKAKEFILNSSYEAFLIYDEDGVMKNWASPGFIVNR